MRSRQLRRVTAVAVLAAACAASGLTGCGYDTNNQNSPNSTQVGTNTPNPTP